MTDRMGNREPGFPSGSTLLIASLLFTWTFPSLADDEDPIPACAKLESDSERIACLEAAIRQQSGQAADSAPVTESEPEPMPESTMEPAQAPESPPLAPEPAASDAAGGPDENYGIKESKPADKDVLRVTVTSVTTNLVGKLVFRTSTGQVWLQTGKSVARFDETPFEAEIRPAMLGSYFIRPVDGGTSIRVRREE